MNSELQPKHSGIIFSVIILINVILGLVFGFVLQILVIRQLGIEAGADALLELYKEYSSNPVVVWVLQNLLHILMIVAVILFFAARKGSFVKDSTLSTKISLKTALMSVALGVSMLTGFLIINGIYTAFLESLGYDFESMNSIPKFDSLQNVIFGLFGVVILPSLSEELIHRGIILRGLKSFGMVKAAIISSLLFMLMHMNFAQALNALMAGFVLSFLYFKTGSLKPGIIVHFVNNLLSLILQTFMDNYEGGEAALMENQIFAAVIGVVSLVGIAALVLCLMYFNRQPTIEGWVMYSQKSEKSFKGLPIPPPYGSMSYQPIQMNTQKPIDYDPFYPSETETPLGETKADSQPVLPQKGGMDLLFALPGIIICVIMFFAELFV